VREGAVAPQVCFCVPGERSVRVRRSVAMAWGSILLAGAALPAMSGGTLGGPSGCRRRCFRRLAAGLYVPVAGSVAALIVVRTTVATRCTFACIFESYSPRTVLTFLVCNPRLCFAAHGRKCRSRQQYRSHAIATLRLTLTERSPGTQNILGGQPRPSRHSRTTRQSEEICSRGDESGSLSRAN